MIVSCTICGNNPTAEHKFTGFVITRHTCPGCGIAAPWALAPEDARSLWNRVISYYRLGEICSQIDIEFLPGTPDTAYGLLNANTFKNFFGINLKGMGLTEALFAASKSLRERKARAQNQ